MSFFRRKLEISEVLPGIWRASAGSRSSASYVVKMSPGAVLIDAGPDATGAAVMQAFQSARVGLRSLRAILLTRGDHEAILGVEALRERTGSRVFCSREVAERLHPFAPDGLLSAGDVVEKHIEVVAPRGDGTGQLGFFFRPNRVLFTGDAPVESFSALDPELVLSSRGRQLMFSADRAR